MPFGNKSKGLTLVYEYGCKAPVTNTEFADLELRGRNRLRNRLVEIEKKFQEQRDSLVKTELDDEIDLIKTQIKDLEQAVRDQKSAAAYKLIDLNRGQQRCREIGQNIRRLLTARAIVPSSTKKKYKAIPILLFEEFGEYLDTRKTIDTLKQNRTAMEPLRKARRLQLFAEHKDEIKALEKERSASVKTARQESGLYWGNYNDVILPYESDHKRMLKHGGHLKFHRFKGDGKLTVQFIKPLQSLFKVNGEFYLEPVEKSAWDRSQGRKRKKLQWTTGRLRIRSDEKSKPVWLTFPVCLHRPLPEGATIQTVSFSKRRVGLTTRFHLLVTIRQELPEVSKKKGEVVVQFGARLQEDRSLQVALLDNGTSRPVILPNTLTSQFEKVIDLRQIRDQHQEVARIAILALRKKDTPEWFREATQYTHLWNAPYKFVRLVKDWKENRFQGDTSAFEATSLHCERYFHLYPWEANLTEKIRLRRREQYRILASQLCHTHGKVILSILPPMPRHKTTEGDRFKTNLQFWRNVASCSNLRQILVNTAHRCGVQIIDANGDPQENDQEALATQNS